MKYNTFVCAMKVLIGVKRHHMTFSEFLQSKENKIDKKMKMRIKIKIKTVQIWQIQLEMVGYGLEN